MRRLAKGVKAECVPCQKQDSKACNETVAPLPEARVSESPPFTVVGIDFAGPLFSVDMPGKKLYICLFTCGVIRAVHLELTESLSTNDFVLAFKRFVARRGLPSIVYSDNAKTFKGAEVRLQALLGPSCPCWKFIAPRSPWWGGWWERLVRSVKTALRKSLGRASLSRTELETTLFEVENCVNSRPLTFVGDEIQGKAPLTPNHFLTAKGTNFQGSVVEDPQNVTPEGLVSRERLCRLRLDKFWEFWRLDYLRSLPVSVSKFHSRGPIEVGSIVLIHEDNVPRLEWALGKVTKLYPGKDKRVRSVELLTSKGTVTRSVQRLHLLELVAECDVKAQSPDSSNVPRVTRSGRVVKTVQKF